MIKNCLIAVLALSTAFLGTFAFRSESASAHASVNHPAGIFVSDTQLQEQAVVVAQAREAVAAAGARLHERSLEFGTVQTELATVREEHAQLQKRARDMESEISILNAARANYLRVTNARSSPSIPTTASLVELLGDSETVPLALDWIKADIAAQYASLFARLDLDEAGRESLLDLLADRHATRLDVSHLGGGALRAADVAGIEQEFRTKLESLVGAGEAELFIRTEQKPLSWERLQRLDQRMRYEATPLDNTQFTEVWTMLSNQITYGPAPRTEALAQAYVQRRIDTNADVLNQAAAILTPTQHAALARQLDDDLAAIRIQVHGMVKAYEQFLQQQQLQQGKR